MRKMIYSRGEDDTPRPSVLSFTQTDLAPLFIYVFISLSTQVFLLLYLKNKKKLIAIYLISLYILHGEDFPLAPRVKLLLVFYMNCHSFKYGTGDVFLVSC